MIDKDLNKAKTIRDDERQTLVVIRDLKTLYKSIDRGIKPLYLALTQNRDFVGASAADKVVGKAAAMLMAELEIKSLHTYIISESALSYLQDKGIMVSYDDKVDFIENRAKDGKCPMELIAGDTDDVKTLLIRLKDFLTKVGAI